MICSVKFKSKTTGGFTGRSYNYFCNIPASVGDLVVVPTSRGDGIAQIVETNIPVKDVDPDVLSIMKEVIRFADENTVIPYDSIPSDENAPETEAPPLFNAPPLVASSDVITVVQLPVIENKLISLKDSITRKVNEALSLACTEDTVKTVKNVRSTLNKEFSLLEEKRKEVKAAILEPYNRFESIYKECVSEIYSSADAELKKKIDSVEIELKNSLAKEVRDYFNEYRSTLGLDEELAPWAGAGIRPLLNSSKKSLKEHAKEYLDRIMDDLCLISGMEYSDEILIEYKRLRNAAEAARTVKARKAALAEMEKRRAAEAAAREEQLRHEEEIRRIAAEEEQRIKQECEISAVPDPIEEPVDVPVEEEPDIAPAPSAVPALEEKTYVVTFEVYGSIEKLKELKKFLENGGYRYEQL